MNIYHKYTIQLRLAFNELLKKLEIDHINEVTIENMLPKSILILLPLAHMLSYRQWKHGILRFPLFWKMWLLAYKFKNRNKERPRTMEISFEEADAPLSAQEISQLKGAICLVASVQSYMTALVPLALTLNEHKIKVCLLIPKEGLSWRAVKGLDGVIKIITIESFMTPSIKERYINNRNRALYGWDNIKPLDFFRGLAPLRDMMEVMPDQVKYVATEIIPQTDAYMECAKEAVKAINPSGVFVARIKRITENVFFRAAKHSGTPVYLLNHGHIGKDWFPLSIGNVMDGVDKVIVWGEQQKGIISNLFPMLPKEVIFPAGGIQWDKHIKKYCGNDRPNPESLRKKIALIFKDIDQNIPWITITMDDGVRRMLPQFFEAIKGLSGFHLFIKIRSDETIESYNNLIDNKSIYPISIVSWDMDISLHELLYCSTLAITNISTSNIDALCVGTPVLTLTLDTSSQKADRYVYLEEYGLPVVSTKNELRNLIIEITDKSFDSTKLKKAATMAAENILSNYPNCDAGGKIVSLLSGGVLTNEC